MATNDPLVKIIQQQIALNSGDISVRTINGNYQYVSTRTGQPIQNSRSAGNDIMVQAGATTSISIQAQIYNYAKGMFGSENVPADLVEVMANLATFYAVNTGTTVTDLFKDGILQQNFLNMINNMRNSAGQIGYSSFITTPSWTNNYLIGPGVLASNEN